MRRLASLAVTLLVVTAALASAGIGAADAGAALPQRSASHGAGTTPTGGTCSFPVTSVDATGTEVTVDDRPDRVVTLAPSAAQTLWEIGGRSQVVGVSQFARYLDGASNRTVVTSGNPATVRVERVVGLNPDLVLAPNLIENETVARLRDAGLTVYRFDAAASIEDVSAKTRLTGRLTGNCVGAAETVRSMRTRVSRVRDAVSSEPEPTVFYAMGGGYTAGPGSFIHELLTAAGAHNVAADANISFYGQISDEVLVREDPEYIVVATANGTAENPKSLVPDSDALRGTTAYQAGNIVVLNQNYLSQPAPRTVEVIAHLARAIHPESFSTGATGTDAAETGPAATTSTTTLAATATTADASTTSESNSPGFGAMVTAVALMVVALFARRRR